MVSTQSSAESHAQAPAPQHPSASHSSDQPCGWQKRDVEPFAVHANFEFGGLAAKRHRLREAGLWNDPPEYYDSGRFVDLKVPAVPGKPEAFENWTDARMVEYHFLAMRSQLDQVGGRPHLSSQYSAGCHIAAEKAALDVGGAAVCASSSQIRPAVGKMDWNTCTDDHWCLAWRMLQLALRQVCSPCFSCQSM